ncbi:hypothetical protein B0T10DRAFT_575435 [Thelonectria olida]|uniref:Uncharacterized protein n=1 Tax=Thelonectria olida TaxID=1576542 RepID=A0A9P9ANK2_9HYPO|nr:hypothetical protein B0T10DRAFT_575435 [Thelonectria olida]
MTVFTETVPTATTTLTLSIGTAAKRDVAASPPKCMTNGVTYPASRITSACSCIGVPATTVSATYTASTETVTYTATVYTTPSATVTTWTTIRTGTTGGVFTVTVGPPYPTNRIINGDFEIGNADGWQLVPESWQGQISTWNVSPLVTGTKSYSVTGSGNSIGVLRQVEPIYLEAGRYNFGLTSSVLLFPNTVTGWGLSAVLDIINPTTGTNLTISLLPSEMGATRQIIRESRTWAVPMKRWFDIPENAAGYNEVSIRYLTFVPPVATIDGIFLQKANVA